MKQFNVTGMSCAACVSRVEKAVKKVDGVTNCSVSLLTNSMGVEGDVSDSEIIAAVENAGYHAASKEACESFQNTIDYDFDNKENAETAMHLKRLVASVLVLLVLMYFSMGHMMFGFKIPSLFEQDVVALGVVELILAAIVMLINQRFFISGFKAAIHMAPNMDTLVALGSIVSFIYSVSMIFVMASSQIADGISAANKYVNNLYFESAAMILVFISVGKTLEARSKGKTTDALKSLMKLAPKTATVLFDGKESVLAIEKVKVGDVFVVKPGESIPVDGVIIEGNSAVDEASLTGESIPVDKNENDEVNAATINLSGYLKCRATRVGKDTTLSQIIEMVNDAAATKAPIAKIADKVAGIFVPCVLAIAFVTFIAWLVVGENIGTALTFATSVLVISCPCSLGLATPVAIMVGNGKGAKNGILYKTAAALEGAGRIQIVALDKTGTITKGEPEVTDIFPVGEINGKELLQLAYDLESRSEHPIAKAIVAKALLEGINLDYVQESKVIPGKGIKAKLQDNCIYGGNELFIEEFVNIPLEIKKISATLSEEGKTPLYFADQDKLFGIIAVADIIKEDAKEAVLELQNMGIQVVMITGDNEKTANVIANMVGIDCVVSGVLPGGKEEAIRNLKNTGKVAMVGDGINDAPALTRADIGVAIGSGTDIAIDAADVVLINNQLRNVPAMIRLGRATLRNIHQNLFWAFFYNSIGIPIAAGVLAGSFGVRLNPMIGALAMSLSSFCVVSNALRLNTVNIFDSRKDRIIKNKISSVFLAEDSINIRNTEESKMKKTIKVTGMMCPHCEAHVKETLEKLDGVEEAVVSHKNGTAVVTLSRDLPDEIFVDAITKENYSVTGIE